MNRELHNPILRALTTSAIAAMLCMPVTASARDKHILSPEQQQLLEAANAALTEDPARLDDAHDAITEALELGERYDILLLTLARIHQKRDECAKAKALFGEMSTAPNDARIPRDIINERKNLYISQMSSMCSARLTFDCSDPDIVIELMGEQKACGVAHKLDPGAYQFSAKLGAQRKIFDVSVNDSEEKTFKVVLMAAIDPVEAPEKPRAPFAYKKTALLGVSTLILSGAAAGTWRVASLRQEEALSAYQTERFDPSLSDDALRTREAEINRFGYMEVGAGWGAIGVGLIGAGLTAMMFTREHRDKQPLSLGFDASNEHARLNMSLRW